MEKKAQVFIFIIVHYSFIYFFKHFFFKLRVQTDIRIRKATICVGWRCYPLLQNPKHVGQHIYFSGMMEFQVIHT